MAILPAEPLLFPPSLFEPTPLPKGHGRWWVMHTKARQEKALARSLCAQGLSYFLPLVRKRTRIRGKDVPSHIPLFSNYLFLHADLDGLDKALSTQRVARPLEVVDQLRFWEELRQIHRLIQTGRPITPEHQLFPGTPVEVRSGPLMGLRGIIVRAASGNRFVVQVDFIQRGASVLFDGDMLEPTLDSRQERLANADPLAKIGEVC